MADHTHSAAAEARDVALKRYAPVLGYLQYENTVYWTRFHIFFLVNSWLLGMLVNRLLAEEPASSAQAHIFGAGAFGGLTLAGIWWLLMAAAERWIERWHEVLRTLEPAAFEGHVLIRTMREGEERAPIKFLAKATVLVFLGAWFLVFAYVVGLVDRTNLNYALPCSH